MVIFLLWTSTRVRIHEEDLINIGVSNKIIYRLPPAQMDRQKRG